MSNEGEKVFFGKDFSKNFLSGLAVLKGIFEKATEAVNDLEPFFYSFLFFSQVMTLIIVKKLT